MADTAPSLKLTYDGAAGEPSLDFHFDKEAGGLLVSVNGEVIAVLQDVGYLDAGSVTLMPEAAAPPGDAEGEADPAGPGEAASGSEPGTASSPGGGP